MNMKITSTEQIDLLAEQRKQEILSSVCAVECGGTAYFVSNSGDDSLDGKSEKTAWKTLKKVSQTDFRRGDVIYLERGSLFRERLIIKTAGVTVSAYGSGIKPRIYGSNRNYNRLSDWEATEYKNLYRCKENFAGDIGLLVFNNGTSHSQKQIIGSFGFKGELSALTGDLDMYYREESGELYLCSTLGHPADRFYDIEICEPEHIVLICADDVTVDNLCVKYGGGHGIAGESKNGLCVQNCELGWIGGTLQYRRSDGSPVRYGNAVEIYARLDGYKMLNNYVYQIYDAAVTHQYFQDSRRDLFMDNIIYKGNLIEYCTYSLEYALATQSGAKHCMRNVTVRDNIMRFAGYGFGSQRPDKDTPAHIKSWDTNNSSENFIIENNIFDRSAYMVVHIAAADEQSLPSLRGNVYVQSEHGQLGRYGTLPTKVCYRSQEGDFFCFDKNRTEIVV